MSIAMNPGVEFIPKAAKRLSDGGYRGLAQCLRERRQHDNPLVASDPVRPLHCIAKLISPNLQTNKQPTKNMLHYSLVFLVIAIIAAVLGFTGIAGAASNIAWILFVVFLVIWIITMVMGKRKI